MATLQPAVRLSTLAVGAGAVLAVTNPHQCRLGSDLIAPVHRPGEPGRFPIKVGRSDVDVHNRFAAQKRLTWLPEPPETPRSDGTPVMGVTRPANAH